MSTYRYSIFGRDDFASSTALYDHRPLEHPIPGPIALALALTYP